MVPNAQAKEFVKKTLPAKGGELLLSEKVVGSESPTGSRIENAWYRENLSELLPLPDGAVGGILRRLRENSRMALVQASFPTTHDEQWRYTNPAAIAKAPLRLSTGKLQPPRFGEQISALRLRDVGELRIVFVNGVFIPGLSALDRLPAGVTISSLLQLSRDEPKVEMVELLKQHLGRLARPEDNFFAALNGSYVQDVAVVEIGPGVALSRPLHLVSLVAVTSEAPVVCPRLLVIAREGSECSIVESYSGPENESYLTAAVTELVLERDAKVKVAKLQLEGKAGSHVGLHFSEQAAKSQLSLESFNFGGALVRNEVRPLLNGEGIETLLNGLTVIGGEQHVDNHLVIDHAKPRCFSREVYKGIYAGSSSGVFSGTIVVHQDAQKTNAVQSNRSLLLSDLAAINTRPQLKIYADDVKCTHGATVGQLDEQALFYLRSRGIDEEQARNILIQAFAEDVVESVGDDALKARLQSLLQQALALH